MGIYNDLVKKLDGKYDLSGLAKVILTIKSLDEVIPFYYRDEFTSNGLKDINSLLEGSMDSWFSVGSDSEFEMESLLLDDFSKDNTVSEISKSLLEYIVGQAISYAEFMNPNDSDYNTYYDIYEEYDEEAEADDAAQNLLSEIDEMDITEELKGVTDPIEVVRIIDHELLELDSDNVYDIEDAIIKSGVSFK